MIAYLDVHLLRVLDRITHLIADEVLNTVSLALTYPEIGDLHPALTREGHVQALLFAGLRGSGYFTIAEANYFMPASASRQIDLAVWLPDARLWLYLEVKPCSPHYGYQGVLADAHKLVEDRPADPRDRLRGALAYGLRHPVKEKDGFPEKYRQLGAELLPLGFREVGIRRRSLEGADYLSVQAGLWVIDQVVEPAPVQEAVALSAPSAERLTNRGLALRFGHLAAPRPINGREQARCGRNDERGPLEEWPCL